MLPSDIHNVYKMVNGKRHQAGRFLVHEGRVHHLEDYYDALDVPEGIVDNYTISKIMNPRPGYSVASDGDMRSGKHLHLIPEAELNRPIPAPTNVTPEMVQQHLQKLPAPVWHYRRAGHDIAHTLEHHGGQKYTLDGNPLSRDELKTVQLNLKNKSATLRYKGPGVADTIAKMENIFNSLRKEEDEEMGNEEALRHVENAVNSGIMPRSALNTLRRQIYTDPMTGGVLGNKYAFGEWTKKPRGGVHMAIDANNFKQINDLYSHEAGDQAIKALGTHLRGAADEATERMTDPNQKAKVFRNPDEQDVHRFGGDEFHVWMPTHAHAANFARKLRDRLASVPPVGGTHRLSVSIGMGTDPHSADAAVYEAKKQKQFAPGQFHTPSTIPHVLAHSAVPGFEGAVPTEHASLPKIDLPEGAKVEPPKPDEGKMLHTPKLPDNQLIG